MYQPIYNSTALFCHKTVWKPFCLRKQKSVLLLAQVASASKPAGSGDIHPPASQAGGTTNVIVPPRKMNKNVKLLKILQNRCERRLFFEKLS